MGSCLRLRAFAYLPKDRFEEDLILNGRDLIKHTKMDAIKKKMQAMKLEKDNAMDRADACEQQAKDANLRAERAEEEVRDLQKKKPFKTLKVRLLPLIVAFNSSRRTWKDQKRGWPPPHKSWPRPRTPLTNLNGYAKCLRIRATQRRTAWPLWSNNWLRPN